MSTIFKDESAQAGGMIMWAVGLIGIGFIYLLLGTLIQGYYDHNNNLINNPQIPYTQEHKDSMSTLFLYWYGVPVIALLIFIIYAIKNGAASKTQEAY